MLISLEDLIADPRNANVCAPDVLEKLTRHIERTGLCPSLLVRPHPKKKNQYVIVDGHHRKLAVASLGWIEVECQVKDITETEAGLLLLTLNRLRGTDIPRKRAELMENLLPQFDLEALSLMLPESTAEIEGLLALLQQDEIELEKAMKAQLEIEKQTLPVPFGFMIPAEEAELVREALAQYQAETKSDQAQALVAICRDVLKLHG
jgi:ParB/RepB/Spo0J family partition protein